jgi:hypothetical protein
MSYPAPDLTGQVFGHWTVICKDRDVSREKHIIHYFCRCSCGKEKIVKGYNIRKGLSPSCGCISRNNLVRISTTHGESKTTPEYRTWLNMIDRCYRPKNKSHARYGGRGITVCERWRNSYEDFLADMGRKPSSEHSIERIDNSKGYEPSNCRWATQKEQQRNRRSNRLVTYNGQTRPVAEWGEILGIRHQIIIDRLDRGWTPERTFDATPDQNCHKITHNGETHSLVEWAGLVGISQKTIQIRLSRGWSVERALTTPPGPNGRKH